MFTSCCLQHPPPCSPGTVCAGVSSLSPPRLPFFLRGKAACLPACLLAVGWRLAKKKKKRKEKGEEEEGTDQGGGRGGGWWWCSPPPLLITKRCWDQQEWSTSTVSPPLCMTVTRLQTSRKGKNGSWWWEGARRGNICRGEGEERRRGVEEEVEEVEERELTQIILLARCYNEMRSIIRPKKNN